jgi:hypothetical protein
MFNNAYHVLRLPALTSKTLETAFQILNRTIWTNNKAYKSRMRPDPNCERCEKTETLEHLLCVCENYSEPLWSKLAIAWTRLFNDITPEAVPRVDLGQINVIYNIPHPSLLLHVHDQASRNALLLLIQEVKRDIVYRRMNLPPSVQQLTDPGRITAHRDSAIRRLCSYLQYIGFVKFAKASTTLQRLQQLNLAWYDPTGYPCLWSWSSMMQSAYPLPTLPHVRLLHTQHSCRIRTKPMKSHIALTHTIQAPAIHQYIIQKTTSNLAG